MMEYRVKEIREAKNIKQYDLAIKAGISREMLDAIEKGRIKILSLETLFRIAEVLGVTTGHILRP